MFIERTWINYYWEVIINYYWEVSADLTTREKPTYQVQKRPFPLNAEGFVHQQMIYNRITWYINLKERDSPKKRNSCMHHTYQYVIMWPDILKSDIPFVQEWMDGLLS
jgi:hypothetical protein